MPRRAVTVHMVVFLTAAQEFSRRIKSVKLFSRVSICLKQVSMASATMAVPPIHTLAMMS